MVKKGQETLRITITAANTESEVDGLVSAFSKIKDYLESAKAPLKPEGV